MEADVGEKGEIGAANVKEDGRSHWPNNTSDLQRRKHKKTNPSLKSPENTILTTP